MSLYNQVSVSGVLWIIMECFTNRNNYTYKYLITSSVNL